MGKYKARGGGSGYWLAGFVLIISIGLIGLTVWLVIKNTKPSTCDVTIHKVSVAQTAVNSMYPVSIDYDGNESNACTNAKVSIAVTLKDSAGNTTTIPAPTDPTSLPSVSQGSYVVQASDPKSTVTVSYFVVNPDGSEGPHHSYP